MVTLLWNPFYKEFANRIKCATLFLVCFGFFCQVCVPFYFTKFATGEIINNPNHAKCFSGRN